jgi:16S rRNA (cytosine967-C5)-methyltransferase
VPEGALGYIGMMTENGLAARAAAMDVLREVLRKGTSFDDAFDGHPELAGLEARDRAFARLLTATVLRRLGQIDDLLARALAKPDPVRGTVNDILRLGAAQLLFLGTPPHAAVDTSVALAGLRGADAYRGLINAVLRRLSREGSGWIAGQDAGRLNTPDWLWLAWRHAYGVARARAVVTAHLEEAPLDLTVKGDPALWAERLEARVMPNGTLRRAAGGGVTELPGFAEGAWWVQDLAAALPARLFGDLAGKTVFDLCAAPGGKTAQLAAQGASVVAVDRSPKRLERVRENLARLGLNAELRAADAAEWEPEAPADAVLLDAPCTATGTIRRHPDLPRLKSPEDVLKLARAQGRLLARAVDLVKVGGTVIYCTCSLQREEGETQTERLLSKDDRLERWPVAAEEVGGLAEAITEHGEVRTLPGMLKDEGGIDGFFVSRLRRVR